MAEISLSKLKMDPSSSSSSNKRKRGLDSYDEPHYKRPRYDVFMNYASEDIGKGFVSHLTAALKRECFTISDDKKLPNGQDKSSELLKAIEDSEIYLIVFSPKYASSKECLDECVLIMESYPKFKHRKVFPIFYNVEPSDVRNQQGLSFLEAFWGHEKNVDPERVQIWRHALKEAADQSGLNSKDWRDEEQLIRKIMKDVRKMKNPQQLCNVEHPVGIDSRAEDVISAIRFSSIVAVLGISGSGKTAVVKAVYDKISADFDVSCFIQDINSYVYRGPNWKVDLQKDVVSCLTGNDKFVASHNDGAAMIKKLISGQKLFLVLDDVYTFEQLQALSIPSASFHCESRIIVTTRNMQSLSNLQHTSYNIELLNTRESFELFTRLIGKGDLIEKKFIDEIVKCSGGIPLVLEVWSRHFTDYDRNLWPSMLETLKRIPHEDTQKKLRISYDSLPKRAQNLFLDIACFFHGMDNDLVVKVLQDEDFFPDVEIQIQNLVHKFLVECYSDDVDEQVRLVLHDVIREMGQEVVRKENEDEPGKRTRLMGYRDVVHVLGDCSGTDSVRSIRLFMTSRFNRLQKDEERVTVQVEAAFKKMSNLRFIQLDDDHLEWSFSSKDDMSCFAFKHLKYLEWQYFPCKSLDNIDMGNVVVIKLWKSKLEKLWDGVKSFKKLKILEVCCSSSLTKTGDFTGLENLEELCLIECENLEELDSSVGCLQKLVSLYLIECAQLKRLPWEMIGKLTSLQQLSLDSQTSLEHLGLWNTVFNTLPNSIRQLHQLTKLTLSKCTNLKSIPDLPPSIKELDASFCYNLVDLPSNCCELQFLTNLELAGCSKLGSEGFKVVTGLRNLDYLGLNNCNVSQVSSRIGNLVSLVILNLSNNTFSSLPESFSNLSKLETLDIEDCSQLQLLPPLPSQLRKIEATNCGPLDVMPYDSMQNAYIFPSKAFKESLRSTEGLYIGLSGEDLPEWCTYQNSGNVLSFVAPIQFDHSKICCFILCATIEKDDDKYQTWVYPPIYNKTKGTSHQLRTWELSRASKMVMFYPLNDTTLVVKAGDTVELQFDDDKSIKSVGLRLVYEDDVVDSGLVLKDVRKPILSQLFPLSSEIMTGNNDDDDDDDDDDNGDDDDDDEDIVMSGELRLVYEDDVVDSGLVLKDIREPLFPTSDMSAGIIELSGDDDVHVNDDRLIIQDDMNPTLALIPSSELEITSGSITHEEICTFPVQDDMNPTLPVFPSPESEIMSGIITHLNDMEIRSSIQDVEYPCYDYSNVVSEFQMYWEGN